MSGTALARVAPGAASGPIVALPSRSKALDRALYSVANGGLSDNAAIGPIREEADHLLAMTETASAAAGGATVLRWLGELNRAVTPLGREEFRSRAPAMAEALAGLPVMAFTAETRNEVTRACEYFPAVARIMALLQPRVEEFHRLRHGLRQVAGAKPPPAPSEPRSAEEVDRILAAFRVKHAAAMAEARAASGTMDNPMDRPEMRPKASPVNQLALLKGYREAALRETDPKRRALLQERADRLAAGLGVPLSIPDGMPAYHQEVR